MSMLKTYSGLLAKDIVCIESKTSRLGDCVLALDLCPGSWVKHRFYDQAPGFGMLVASGKHPNWKGEPEDFVTVLWSVEPRNPFSSMPSTGFVYAPYVPLQVTKITLEPDDFKLSAPRYYSHKVNKSNFSSIKVIDIK
jgi:hypothetical protein